MNNPLNKKYKELSNHTNESQSEENTLTNQKYKKHHPNPPLTVHQNKFSNYHRRRHQPNP
jgi:hypothetical protein